MVQILVLKKFAWGGKCDQTLSVELMSARIANISEVKVLNKFAWGSKCDQTLAIERVCSGMTIIIKGKMC